MQDKVSNGTILTKTNKSLRFILRFTQKIVVSLIAGIITSFSLILPAAQFALYTAVAALLIGLFVAASALKTK